MAQAAPTGDNQIGLVQTALVNPLRIVVLDAGNPQPGVPVNWSGLGTNPSFNPASGQTDANGIATTMWTLPQEAGTPTAQADVPGVAGSPVVFTATARPDVPASLVLISGDGQAGGLGELADEPLRVEVRDQYGNGVSGVDVDWVVTQGFASVPSTTQSGTNGQAEASVIYGQVSLIPITVTATVAGVGSVTFDLISGHLVSVEDVVGGSPRFFPANLSITQGAHVVWKWAADARNHNVVPNSIFPTRSGNPTNGPNTYVFQFTVPANYAYFCETHVGQGMTGLISVN